MSAEQEIPKPRHPRELPPDATWERAAWYWMNEHESLRAFLAEAEQARDRNQRNLDTAHAALCGASRVLLEGDTHEAHGWLTRQEGYQKAVDWKRELYSKLAEAEAEREQAKRDLYSACNECGSDDPELDERCPLRVAERERDRLRGLLLKRTTELGDARSELGRLRLSNPDKRIIEAVKSTRTARAALEEVREVAIKVVSAPYYISETYCHHEDGGPRVIGCPVCALRAALARAAGESEEASGE